MRYGTLRRGKRENSIAGAEPAKPSIIIRFLPLCESSCFTAAVRAALLKRSESSLISTILLLLFLLFGAASITIERKDAAIFAGGAHRLLHLIETLVAVERIFHPAGLIIESAHHHIGYHIAYCIAIVVEVVIEVM